MSVRLTALLLLTLPASSLGAQDHALARLQAEITRIAGHLDGTVGVAALHLESGRSVAVNGDVPFPMASTYKVPIGAQLLHRVDLGEIALSDMVEVTPEDLHPGSGTISYLLDDPGVVLSLHNLFELMLLISDNSATDMVLRAAGGPGAVNERMAALGISGLNVARPTSVLISDWVGVEGVPITGRITMTAFRDRADSLTDEARDEAARRFAADLRDTSTPIAMAALLAAVWRGEALSDTSTELFIDAMLRVETGTARLKGMLPPETEVGHKTGTIGGTTNDVGVIYLPHEAGHVVTVVFVKDAEDGMEERESTIAQIARAIYDYFLFAPSDP